MTTGVVKFFNKSKGFGFIDRDNGDSDVFVHISTVEKSGLYNLSDGQRVSFDIERDEKGRDAAHNIKLI